MREIKFRAWHKRRKKMYKVQDIYLLSKHIRVEVNTFENRICSFDEVILEQYEEEVLDNYGNT